MYESRMSKIGYFGYQLFWTGLAAGLLLWFNSAVLVHLPKWAHYGLLTLFFPLTLGAMLFGAIYEGLYRLTGINLMVWGLWIFIGVLSFVTIKWTVRRLGKLAGIAVMVAVVLALGVSALFLLRPPKTPEVVYEARRARRDLDIMTYRISGVPHPTTERCLYGELADRLLCERAAIEKSMEEYDAAVQVTYGGDPGESSEKIPDHGHALGKALVSWLELRNFFCEQRPGGTYPEDGGMKQCTGTEPKVGSRTQE